MAGTNNADLVLNTGVAELPFINLRIPTASFFIVAPVLILFTHIYLHILSHRFWMAASQLPAIFPDGRALDEHSIGWILTSSFRRKLPILKNKPIAFKFITASLPGAMIFLLAPVTLLLFWQNNIPSHHYGSLITQIILISFSIVFSFRSNHYLNNLLVKNNHDGKIKKIFLMKTSLLDLVFFSTLISIFTILMYLAFESISVIKERSYEGYQGNLYQSEIKNVTDNSLMSELGEFSANLLSFQGTNLIADLSHTRLTTIPNGWIGEKIEDYENIRGPSLRNRDLRGIKLNNSFLPKADFGGSDLTGANFSYADLRMAHFGAYYDRNMGWGILITPREFNIGYRKSSMYVLPSLSLADFTGSKLRYSTLIGNRLNDTYFTKADLRNSEIGFDYIERSYFLGSDLRNAKFRGTVSEDTFFYGSRLEGADLSLVNNLSPKQMAFVTYNEFTRFPDNFSKPEIIKKLLNELGYFMMINEIEGQLNITGLSNSSNSTSILDQSYNIAKKYFLSEDDISFKDLRLFEPLKPMN